MNHDPRMIKFIFFIDGLKQSTLRVEIFLLKFVIDGI